MKKPTACPVCGDPLVTMYRVIERLAKNSRYLGRPRYVKAYVPYHVCGACKVAVRVMQLRERVMSKLVVRKPST